MAPVELTEYERQRLENIKRNNEMIACLAIHSKLSTLTASTKRQRVEKLSYKSSPGKKPKSEEPVVIRRSLRTRGMPPDSEGLTSNFLESDVKLPKPVHTLQTIPRAERPLGIQEVNQGSGSDQAFINAISKMSKFDSPDRTRAVEEIFDLNLLSLEPEYVARVVPGRIMSVKFFPTSDMEMIAVGNKFGNVGFWDLKSEDGDGGRIHLYQPHSAPVSGISVHPSSLSKMYTSCYDGILRVMDMEKEEFSFMYSTEDSIFALSQQLDDPKCIYFGEGRPGALLLWDERIGKVSGSWTLHNYRINTIDFNPSNTKIMATSSTDGTASLWDLRQLGAKISEALMTAEHKRAVHSAYFSPSGTHLATTSADDKIGVLSGPNYEDISMLHHDNQTGRWISSFRAIWGWDDDHVFVGNMKRGVDILSVSQGETISTLRSPHISAIPCRFDAHPYKKGALAGATSGGQVYIWDKFIYGNLYSFNHSHPFQEFDWYM